MAELAQCEKKLFHTFGNILLALKGRGPGYRCVVPNHPNFTIARCVVVQCASFCKWMQQSSKIMQAFWHWHPSGVKKQEYYSAMPSRWHLPCNGLPKYQQCCNTSQTSQAYTRQEPAEDVGGTCLAVGGCWGNQSSKWGDSHAMRNHPSPSYC